MSEQDAQAPESETLDIAIDFASGRYVEVSQDDLNTALAAASLCIHRFVSFSFQRCFPRIEHTNCAFRAISWWWHRPVR